MSASAFVFECDACGATLDAREPGPEAHEPDCPVRRRKIELGVWEEPDD